MLHDKTYESVPVYKKYTDKGYTSAIHKATLVAFISAFVMFYLAQSVFPGLFSFKTPVVKAGANTVTWTSQADFTNNNGATGTVANSNADLTTTANSVQLSASNFSPQGTGADGPLTVVGGSIFNINTQTNGYSGRTAADGVLFPSIDSTASGQKNIIVNSATTTGLAVNDEVMVIDAKGTSVNYNNVGLYEFGKISSITNGTPSGKSTIVLTGNLTNAYDGTTQKIVVQRIPNYTNVTVTSVGYSGDSSLTAKAWDGTSGGVLAFRANGTVTVDSTGNGGLYKGYITANGLGYRGGTAGVYNFNALGGESYNGGLASSGGVYNGAGQTTVGGGGGGGIYTSTTQLGGSGQAGGGGGGGGASLCNSLNCVAYSGYGGGGGYGGVGGAVSGGNPGVSGSGGSGTASLYNSGTPSTTGGIGGGGGVYGTSAQLNTQAYFGSGGGASGGTWTASPATNYAGSVGASGGGLVFIGANQVTAGAYGSITSVGSTASGGGSGAGGSIVINTKSISNSGTVSASGGPASGGAAGGGGRTYLKYGTKAGNAMTPNYAETYSAPYQTIGTLGGPVAGNVGLRYDAGVGQKVKATSLTWNGSTAAAGQKILFKVRAGDTQAELDTNQCYGPTTLDSGCADWSTAGKFFSQINGSSNSGTGIPTGILSKRYVEVLVRLESSGADTPVLNDVSLVYDSLEAPTNSNITLTKTDGSALKDSTGATITGGTPGATTNATSLRVSVTGLTCGYTSNDVPVGSKNCAVSSTNLRPAVEIQPVGTGFTGTATAIATAGNNYVDLSALSPGTSYHLQVESTDDQGRVSAWTAYGGNAEAAADITIDQVAPTVSVSLPATYTTSTATTVTFTAADADSKLSQLWLTNNSDNTGWVNVTSNIVGTYIGQSTVTNLTVPWTLSSGDGAKTIYAKVVDNAGNTSGKVFTSGTDWSVANTPVNIDSTAETAGDLKLAGSQYAIYANNYIAGRSSTALAGKFVYNADLSLNPVYKTAQTSCVGPQCSTSLDSNYPSSYALVSPQTNSGVVFSPSYPAQDGCKSLGGRLPYTNELAELYAGRATYGNFSTGDYWSATENGSAYAWIVAFPSGSSGYDNKNFSTDHTRCVADNKPVAYSTPGTLGDTGTAVQYDAGVGVTQKWGALSWGADTLAPGQAIEYQVSTDGTSWKGPDGNVGSWSSNYFGQIYNGSPITDLSKISASRYLYVKVQLSSGGSDTPVLHDISIQSVASAATTLDTTAPTVTSSTLTAPNGSEKWKGGAVQAITWNSAGITDAGSGLRTSTPPIQLDYSTDGGSTYPNSITAGTANTGTFSWTVPSVDSNTVKIRLTAYDAIGNSLADYSDANFTIDSTAPTGSITSLSSTYKTSPISVPYTSSDGAVGSGVASVKLYYTTQTVTPYTWTQYGATYTSSPISFTVPGDNHYGFKLVATDNVGNAMNIPITTTAPDQTTVYDSTIPTANSVASISLNPNNTGSETVTWNAFSDPAPSSGFGSYQLQRKTGSGGTYANVGSSITNVNTLSYADSGLGEGTYYYRLVTTDAAGNTVNGSDSTPLIVDQTNPATETVSTISPNPNNTGNQTITWSAFSDSGTSSGFQKYVLQRKLSGGSYADVTTVVSSGTTSYVDSAVLAGGTYYYRVNAYDNAGNSSTGSDSAALVVDKNNPNASNAPTFDLNPNKTGNQALSWTGFSDTGASSGFQKYLLQRKMLTPTLGSYVVAATINTQGTTSYADNSNLSEGTYVYNVVTYDNAGNYATSADSATLVVDKTSPVVTPASFTVTEGISSQASTVHLNLSATDTGGSNLAYFELKNETDSWSAQTPQIAIVGSPSSTTITSYAWPLSSGDSNKTISARFFDNAGNISTDATVSIYHDTTNPGPVTNFYAYQDSGLMNNITTGNTTLWYPYVTPYFSWSAPNPLPGSGVATYKYCFATDANCTPSTSTVGNGTNLTGALGSSQDGTYYLRIIAVSNVGLNSSPVTFQYNFDQNAPGHVSNLRTTAGSDPLNPQITVQWDPYPTQGFAPLEHYYLERVEYRYYVNHALSVDASSDWSLGDGYDSHTLGGSTTSYTDNVTASTKYVYRIRAKDVSNASYGPYQNLPVYGMTADTTKPDVPPTFIGTDGTTAYKAYACTKTASPCAATDSDGNTNRPGFSVKLYFSPATDYGSGMSEYKIYRNTVNDTGNAATWQVVGVLPYQAGQTTVWYDNDAHNIATYGTDKLSSTTPLNDSTLYYYRVTAVDLAGNENNPIPLLSDPIGQLDNSTSAQTPDVTAPAVPGGLTVNPMGHDTSLNDTQMIDISWGTSIDCKANSDCTTAPVPTDNIASTNITYKVYQSTDPNVVWSSLTPIKTLTNITSFTQEGLLPDADYYYRVTAQDGVPNVSAMAAVQSAHTFPTATPSVPQISQSNGVVTTKGDPNTDATVGHAATITFNGSHTVGSKVTGYQVWRSTTNLIPNTPGDPTTTCLSSPVREQLSDCWNRINGATNLNLAGLNEIHHQLTSSGLIVSGPVETDSDTVYQILDAGLTDATQYFYRVRAQNNIIVPNHPDQSNLFSGLSTVSPQNVHYGWDITPDATAPMLPADLTVKDIHDDGMSYKRNIITWARITTPTRNGANDFREYRIYRRAGSDPIWYQICSSGTDYAYLSACTSQNPNPLFKSDKIQGLANNYFMDLIPISQDNENYDYYVTAADDADHSYFYPNSSTLVNPDFTDQSNNAVNTANESAPNRKSGTIAGFQSINPAVTHTNIIPVDSTSGDACQPYIGKMACIKSVGVSSAQISWSTDQPSDSVVEFKVHGSGDPYVGVIDRAPTENHLVTVKPLSPSTQYDYIITSRNSLKNDTSADSTTVDSTTHQPVLPALTTSGFTIGNITTNSTTTTAIINWSTNIQADGNYVEYQMQRLPGDDAIGGTSGEDMTPVLDPTTQLLRTNLSSSDISAYLLNHKVVIGGLKSSRTYTFKIRSVSTDGYVTYSELKTFATKTVDTAQFSLAPTSSNVADRNINSTTAQIVWQTAVPTTTWIEYGSSHGQYGTSAGDNNLTTTHVVTLTGLVPGTTYYYRARVKDANDVEYTSPEYSFTAVIKPKISNMQVKDVSPYSVTIAWDTNVDTETVLNWGKTSAYGEKHGTAGTSQVHQVTIDNLDDNTEYHYQIVAHDAAGNEVVGEDAIVRTPLDTEGPKILNVKTDIMPLGDSDTTAQVIVSWQTNKPATTLIQYDEGIIGGHYTKASTLDTSLNNSHTVIVKGLDVATTYHYHIVTQDKRGNTTTSNDYTFVTPSKEQSIWNLIVNSLQQTFAWTKNLGSLFKRK